MDFFPPSVLLSIATVKKLSLEAFWTAWNFFHGKFSLHQLYKEGGDQILDGFSLISKGSAEWLPADRVVRLWRHELYLYKPNPINKVSVGKNTVPSFAFIFLCFFHHHSKVAVIVC